MEPATEALSDDLAGEGEGIYGDNATSDRGASSTNFSSTMHNVINQFLLCIKADAAADLMIEAHNRKDRQKPIGTVSNTMEAMITEFARESNIREGDPIEADFRDVLKRYLERSRRVTIRMGMGQVPVIRQMTDAELGRAGVEFYNEVMAEISASEELADIPLSPIDWAADRLRKAGMRVQEITGRKLTIDYSGKVPVLKSRSGKDVTANGRTAIIKGFNSDNVDALFLNEAGSTGISLHASKEFSDKKQRHMFIIQPDANIDTHMQMLGRVHRTGQVIEPEYTQVYAEVPAERRPAAVLAKKMASLSANTTGSRESSVADKTEDVDILNYYGDIAALEFADANPDIMAAMSLELDSREDAARKLTGRIPLLPTSVQDEVYTALTDRYKALTELAKATGTYKLEAQTIPLDAKLLEKEQIIAPVAGETGPFAAAVVREKVDAKRIGKPLTPEEALKATGKESWEQAKADGKKEAAEDIKAVTAQFEAFITRLESELKDGRKMIGDARDKFTQWAGMRDTLSVGKVVQFKDKEGTDIEGVVVAVKRKAKGQTGNPANLGQWDVSVATSGTMRTVTMPFSQVTNLIQSRMKIEDLTKEMTEGGREVRETRYLMTGNLLAAFSATGGVGQITRYTTSTGEVRSGLLMPQAYDPKKQAVSSTFRNADQAVEFFATYEDARLGDAEGTLVIGKFRGRNSVHVKRGGAKKFILDPDLL
jgi:hypothetical protein